MASKTRKITLDPPIRIDIQEFEQLFRRRIRDEFDEYDDEHDLDNWITDKIIEIFMKKGIPILLETIVWEEDMYEDNIISEIEFVVPENNALLEALIIRDLTSANIEEILNLVLTQARQNVMPTSRPRPKKIRFDLDTGKKVPQRNKGQKRKVRRVSNPDEEPYKRRRGMFGYVYDRHQHDHGFKAYESPLLYLFRENNEISQSYPGMHGLMSDEELERLFFTELSTHRRLKEMFGKALDGYINHIKNTGHAPLDAIDKKYRKEFKDILQNNILWRRKLMINIYTRY
jgi:hypothetical protein